MQRLRMRTFEALRGSSASFKVASNRSSASRLRSMTTTFSAARLPANRSTIRRRRLFFSTALFFAMANPVPSLPERHRETGEELSFLLVGPRRRADDDVHAPILLDVVEVDLGEDDLLAHAERVVAAPVEALGRHAA